MEEKDLSDLKRRVLKYHVMLTVGCGNSQCQNPNCASRSGFQQLSSSTALTRAIELTTAQAPECSPPLPSVTISNTESDPTGLIALSKTGNIDAVTERIREVFVDADSICSFFTSADCCPIVRDMFEALTVDESIAEALFQVLIATAERVHVAFTMRETTQNALLATFFLLQTDAFLDPANHKVLRELFMGLIMIDAPDRQKLIQWFATTRDDITKILSIIQTYISVRWVTGKNMAHIGPAVQVLGIINEANDTLDDPVDYEEFHNELINCDIDVRATYFDSVEPNRFSFARYPFILDPVVKSNLLQLDAEVQMRTQFDEAVMRFMFQQQIGGASPFLVLQVRRDNLVEDTLQQLQGKGNDDFKKPLKVKFVGEEGIDEGGIQKEFFQLLMKKLFNPEYGMFVVEEDTHEFWFNKDSLESELEFELIGIMLGLAIYNSVILDVRFPLVVYKKLLNRPIKFNDLKGFNQSLHKGLEQLLHFDGDVESVFSRTFSIEYSMYGMMKTVELCPGGSSIALTNANRKEYVDLFVDYTFNKSVRFQFTAFQNGFEMVCGGHWLRLFRSEELELSICGSPVLDFHALEAAARYENYTSDSHTIKNFWKVVHEMDNDQKRRFLSFCTGSDRVPINGLGSLKVPFIIAKNGADSDRLPTSHTCFNHLLLPEYSSLERLRDRLLVAIQNSEGFGLM